MAERSVQVGSPLRSLTMPELNIRRKRRKVRAKRMRRGGRSRPGGRGRRPGFSRKMRRKPASRRRVSHWKERKSWPRLTKESQQSQARSAPRGRRVPVMMRMEATIPRSAMSWRERSEGPKIQARVGRARRVDAGATISETRWRRVWAGRIP